MQMKRTVQPPKRLRIDLKNIVNDGCALIGVPLNKSNTLHKNRVFALSEARGKRRIYAGDVEKLRKLAKKEKPDK